MKILKKEEAEKLFCHRCLFPSWDMRLTDQNGMLYSEWVTCCTSRCMAWQELKDGAGYCSDLSRPRTNTEPEIDILKRKLIVAEKMLENLKCCENCGHMEYDDGSNEVEGYILFRCDLGNSARLPYCCDKWIRGGKPT